jgi:hypothetical protein
MFNHKNLKQKFDNFLVQKIFSQHYYDKCYLRNEFLDTNSTFYNYKQNTKLGFSINRRIYTYSHIHNGKFTFNSFLNKEIGYSTSYIDKYYNTLFTLKSNKKSFSFFLLRPIKGGFYSYHSGIVGFIPTSHVKLLVHKLLSRLQIKDFITLLYNFNGTNGTLNCFRFFLYKVKIKLLRFYKKRHFSHVKRVIYRKTLSNSVFLLKNTKKHYELKKFKKRY